MNLINLALLSLLSALFASAFLFIRLLAPVFGPFMLMDLRVWLAAILLFLWAFLSKQQLNFSKSWHSWLLLGALNAAIPYTLIAFAELQVSSALAAILMSTIPLFTAIATFVFMKESFTPRKIIGLLLGLFGVVVLSSWNPQGLNSFSLFAILALLLSALSYALGIVYAAMSFKSTSPLSITIGNFLAAGILLLPFAITNPPQQSPSTLAMLALFAMVLIPTAAAFTLDFHLLKKLGPTHLSLIAYLIPIFGAFFGRVFLGEDLSVGVLLGFIIILFSVALVTEAKLVFFGKRLL